MKKSSGFNLAVVVGLIVNGEAFYYYSGPASFSDEPVAEFSAEGEGSFIFTYNTVTEDFSDVFEDALIELVPHQGQRERMVREATGLPQFSTIASFAGAFNVNISRSN